MPSKCPADSAASSKDKCDSLTSSAQRPPHYRYRFKQWGIKKRTVKEEKEQLIKRQAKRTRDGASVSDLSLVQGGFRKEIDDNHKKQLKRYINDQIRKSQFQPISGPVYVISCLTSPIYVVSINFSLGTRFINWNLPYSALLPRSTRNNTHPSSSAQSPASPDDVEVNSRHGTQSPSSVVSQSPTTKLIRKKIQFDASSLLLQGRHEELLRSMGTEDRK